VQQARQNVITPPVFDPPPAPRRILKDVLVRWSVRLDQSMAAPSMLDEAPILNISCRVVVYHL
jgi:hypothetical protein